MSDKNNPYGFSEYFKSEIKKFKLISKKVMPYGILLSKHTKNSYSLVSGNGNATMMGLNGTPVIILDFGTQIVGKIQLNIEVNSNCRIKISYGEYIDETLRDSDFTCGWYKMPLDCFNLIKGIHKIESNGRRAFRYIRIELIDCRFTDYFNL